MTQMPTIAAFFGVSVAGSCVGTILGGSSCLLGACGISFFADKTKARIAEGEKKREELIQHQPSSIKHT